MSKKRNINVGLYVTPNKKFKRYHKLYTKSIINLTYSTNNIIYDKLKQNEEAEPMLYKFNFIIKSTEYLKLPSEQLQACLKIGKRILKKKGYLLPRVYTYLPLTKKPSETRMGKGKSSRVSKWIYPVKPGKLMFELSAKNYDLAKQVFRAVCNRLPIKLLLIQLKI
jgi:large subunit ribosomal protein L16